MKLTFIVLSLLLVLMSTRALAVTCPAESDISPSAKAVRDMVPRADQFSSVEGFIAALPNEMRSNFVMMADSRSFQASTRDNPRVLLASSDGSVRVTFGTDPSLRGYNNIEISVWNPAKGEFEYQEVTFSPQDNKMHGHDKPMACAACHGKPAKPNWDTYNYWSGAVPFNKDKLVRGSQEADWYMGYLKRIETQSPANARFNALKPLITSAQVEETFKNDNVIQIPFQDQNGNITNDRDGQGGISVQMFDRANDLMQCAHAQRIRKKPLFDNAKYLLTALRNRCDMDAFMSPWLQSSAENFFRSRIPGLSVKGANQQERYASLRQQVRDETYKRQMNHRKRKEGRQKAFWLREFTNDFGTAQASAKLEEEWKRNIDAIGLNVVGTVPGSFQEDIGESPEGVGDLRLFLEPLGIPVSSFSTSVDPSDYAFADIFDPDYILDSDVAAIEAENTTGKDTCEFLADRNREKMLGQQAEVEKFTSDLCRRSDEIATTAEGLEKNATAAVRADNRAKVKDIVERKCLQCHQDIGGGQTASGAPVFPFNDLDAMERLFNSPEGQFRDYRAIMQDRINRPTGTLGAMPVKYISELQTDEIANLNVWLNSVRSNP